MTQYKAHTTDPLVPPVYPSELADWVRGDESDPLYKGLLISATSVVIAALRRDLINRTWNLTYQTWPTGGTLSIPSISPDSSYYLNEIELPYTNLIVVDAVISYGELKTTDDYSIIDLLPAKLCFCNSALSGYYSNCDDAALEVQYVAGYGESQESVPEEIRQAILMVAGYMYLHRGCSAKDALSMSGADEVLTPFKICAGIVI